MLMQTNSGAPFVSLYGVASSFNESFKKLEITYSVAFYTRTNEAI